MPKDWIKRHMPDADKIKNNKVLRLLGPVLFEPRLWHLHRRNVAKACAIGIFCAFMPVPVQMLMAAVMAIYSRANLPVSLLFVWVSNPLTIPPMFYFCYKVGTWILGVPVRHIKFEVSFHWLVNEIAIVWKPLFLGSIICGLIAAVIAYFVMRLLWRLWVIKHWEYRARRRQKQGL